jgi:hypothetical protein
MPSTGPGADLFGRSGIQRGTRGMGACSCPREAGDTNLPFFVVALPIELFVVD